MQILIVKDSATKVPREVNSVEEARAAANGMVVEVLCEDGVWRELPSDVVDAPAPEADAPAPAPTKKAAAKKAR